MNPWRQNPDQFLAQNHSFLRSFMAQSPHFAVVRCPRDKRIVKVFAKLTEKLVFSREVWYHRTVNMEEWSHIEGKWEIPV
jgi:hypothetical protein